MVLIVRFPGMIGEAVCGQPAPSPGIAEREARRQQEQERQRLLDMRASRPDVRLQPEAPAPARLEYPGDESPCFPLRKGGVFNIRKAEQGLENLRRIPTVKTDIKLIPGEAEGESGIEVTRKQGRPVRVLLSDEDHGKRACRRAKG